MSRWIGSKNVFVAPTRKGETLPKLADLLKNELFVFIEEGESLLHKSLLSMHAEQRLETALRCFPKLEKNWMRQLTTSNYWDWKECANPLILIHFFVIWLCKSLSVINILLKTLTSWAHREKTVQDKVTFMHEHKENCLELFKSRRHFGELSWTT